MINETDIDAFSDDIKEVGEFVRRAKKGLPEDRWYDGVTGAKRLALACDGLLALVQVQADAMAAMYQAIHAAGAASMEPARDPCRDYTELSE